MPYLVPKAAKLIEDIGKAFQDSLHNRGYNRNHKITITSVLRTEDNVKNLRRTNVNSSENSCHCFGTTVDISYFSFETPEFGRTASIDKMRQVLMQVVYDLRNEGRCVREIRKAANMPSIHRSLIFIRIYSLSVTYQKFTRNIIPKSDTDINSLY